jgi:uncharacterized protein YjbI with pentapeptide repeats
MPSVLNRRSRLLQFAAAMISFIAFAGAVRADIFQWEYFNPADPSQGKRQSTTLAPDGAGVDATPSTGLSGRNLTRAYLQNADLTNASASHVNLTEAALTNANLTAADFSGATFTGAELYNAEIRGADFGIILLFDFPVGVSLDNSRSYAYYRPIGVVGTGITLDQLYSTASYQNHDLQGIGLPKNSLADVNFANQNLADAHFQGASLVRADFQDANLTNVDFSSADLTAANLRDANLAGVVFRGTRLSQVNFAAQDFTEVIFDEAYLESANFTGADVRAASFYAATLTNADFTGADLRGANFDKGILGCGEFHCSPTGTGITPGQVYPTASYQQRDLSDVNFMGNDFTGANLAGQNLSNVNFTAATLTNANFTGAEIRGAKFKSSIDCYKGCTSGTGISPAQLYSTANYEARDLNGIDFGRNSLAGANFTGQGLTGANFDSATLSDANFEGATLINASFVSATLTGTNFHQANLTNANFEYATLTNTDFSGAKIGGASFRANPYLGGISLTQLYSTASYQQSDLWGIKYSGGGRLAGANFAHQDLSNAHFDAATLTNADFQEANLTRAYFKGATLTDADFTDAEVRGADFGIDIPVCEMCGSRIGTGIMLGQLYSTASYKAHDLSGITVVGNNLASGNFTGQRLTDANFSQATVTGADFTDAEIRGASFVRWRGAGGISLTQLYSTASYQTRDLSGVNLSYNNLDGANFAGQNLTDARLGSANLTNADFTDADVRGASLWRYEGVGGISLAQLYSTASYRQLDLRGIGLSGNNLTSANFSGQNLTGANFGVATLTGADFTGSEIRGASFWRYQGVGGISLAQLYSTASYKAHDLSGINLSENDLTGAHLAGQNLTNANIDSATLTGADVSAADARGMYGYFLYWDAITTNLIWPNGHIHGLVLDDGGSLVVRDYDGNSRYYEPALPAIPITIDEQFATARGGTLRMVFEADHWDSTIAFAPDIPVALGGTLELTFAADVNLSSQVGRTLDLFDWTGVSPTGAFAISSPYTWDLSHLYTAGEVTLLFIPEPSTLLLFGSALTAFFALGRIRYSFNSTKKGNS